MHRFLLAVASIGLLGIGLTPIARADAWDKKTKTVNEAIQVPHTLPPPGACVMTLLDSLADGRIVQIFHADETEVLQPRALRAWCYPGDGFGREFAYLFTPDTQEGDPK